MESNGRAGRSVKSTPPPPPAPYAATNERLCWTNPTCAETIDAFFLTFGTHVASQGEMGAKQEVLYVFNEGVNTTAASNSTKQMNANGHSANTFGVTNNNENTTTANNDTDATNAAEKEVATTST